MAFKERTHTQAHADANKRYDDKTYKKYNIAFRIEEDADIIAALDQAHKKRQPGRELIHEWYDAANKDSD
jgi:hypothetical protein